MAEDLLQLLSYITLEQLVIERMEGSPEHKAKCLSPLAFQRPSFATP